MIDISRAGRFTMGSHTVNRMGYGAMQLAGKGVFGPPKDRAGALAVLREAVESGVDHIDTSDFYGPHVTNQIIAEALHPYPKNLVIVTKVSAKRGEDGSWIPAFSREELTEAVHSNLRNLKLDVLDVVNCKINVRDRWFSAQAKKPRRCRGTRAANFNPLCSGHGFSRAHRERRRRTFPSGSWLETTRPFEVARIVDTPSGENNPTM